MLTIQDWKAGSPQTQTFTYDDLDRLLTAGASGGTGGTYSESYVYNSIGNLTSKGGVTLIYAAQSATCPAGALTKPHAAVSKGTNTYCYDQNGNQVTRNVGSAVTLTYNHDNQLTATSGGATSSFVYDGDGNRVKGTVAGVTTTYVGTHYEVEGATTRKYYYLGGQRVAMLENSTVYYLLGDHLGSTALTVNSAGAKYGELRYKAFGETRYTFGTTPTSFGFTGQRQESGLGLYFYNARWYDAALGRFIQADTIVPNFADPQSLNRFTYVGNNPLKYVDPSGHTKLCGVECEEEEDKKWNPPKSRVRNTGPKVAAPVSETIIFGGSFTTSAIEEEGPPVAEQMPAWTTDQYGNPIPESNFVQYPGSKYEQAESAKGLALNSSASLICYSSGTESCLMYAQWRISQGLGVEDVALLGPTFLGANTEGGPAIGFGASGGELDDWASYIDYLLVNGTDVLVIDDGNNPFDTNEASTYRAPVNTTGTFVYQLMGHPHYDAGGFSKSGTNNSPSVKYWVYELMKTW